MQTPLARQSPMPPLRPSSSHESRSPFPTSRLTVAPSWTIANRITHLASPLSAARLRRFLSSYHMVALVPFLLRLPIRFLFGSLPFSACPLSTRFPLFRLLRQCPCMYIELRLQRDPHSFLFGSPARYVITCSLVQSNRLNFGSPASAEPNNARLLRPLRPQSPLQQERISLDSQL